jgi:hypothetical protein
MPVHATVGRAGRQFTIPAGVTRYSGASDDAQYSVTRTGPQAAETVTCTEYADTPFEYYGGGEEGIASLECSQVVYEIEVVAALFLNGSEVSYGVNTVYSTSETSADAIYPLSAGTYQTYGQGYGEVAFGDGLSYIGEWDGPTTYLP